MFDYKGIIALKTILESQNFEVAANKLYISQSAISQRIKSLEIHLGKPLLIRKHPYKATRLGQNLLNHLAKVEWLENDLLQNKLIDENKFIELSISINNDSLETYFFDILDSLENDGNIRYKIKKSDQDMTVLDLQNGEVLTCISTSNKNIKGCKTEYLGEITYLLVCSPLFYKKYFNENVSPDTLRKSPYLVFNQYDNLSSKFIEKNYNFSPDLNNCHIIPSVKGFKQLCLSGKGYALIPKIDIIKELNQGQLKVINNISWKMPLYWHCWELSNNTYKNINSTIIAKIRQKLLNKV